VLPKAGGYCPGCQWRVVADPETNEFIGKIVSLRKRLLIWDKPAKDRKAVIEAIKGVFWTLVPYSLMPIILWVAISRADDEYLYDLFFRSQVEEKVNAMLPAFDFDGSNFGETWKRHEERQEMRYELESEKGTWIINCEAGVLLMCQIWLVVLCQLRSRRAIWMSKRSTQTGAVEVLKHCLQKPVLFLRSHSSDEPNWIEVEALATDADASLPCSEAAIGKKMEVLGPFVALGQPHEIAPQLGAWRLYTSMDSWKEVVEIIAKRASAVVLRIGNSEGIQWELKTVGRIVPLTNLLLISEQTMSSEILVHLNEIWDAKIEWASCVDKPIPKGFFIAFSGEGKAQILSFEEIDLWIQDHIKVML
jgi:hypothetical protein